MKRNKLTEIAPDGENKPTYNKKVYAYISAGLTAAGAVFLALIFTKLGIYSLIASVILSLAALAFVNVQKRKNSFGGLKYFTAAAYAVLALSIAVFVGGLIWSAI